ncbi:MAG: glycosyltransferase family 87 protein [Planctomycetota bacterium]
MSDGRQPEKMTLPARLGWGHRGFHATSGKRALLGLLLLLLLPFLSDVIGALRFGMQRGYVDLRIWYSIGPAFMSDPRVPLYETYPSYLYPPFFLTLITPLFKLPANYATAIFQLLKWAALVVSLRLAWRLCSPRGEDVPPIVALGSLLLAGRFLANSMTCGNINMFILAAMLTGAWLITRGRQVGAGFVIGVVACIKVMPALLLAYFVYKRWWRTLWGAALAAAVCLLLYPALFLGWENNLRQLQGWWEYLPQAFLEHGRVNSVHSNQAFAAVLNRLFGGYPAYPPDIYLTPIVWPAWVMSILRIGGQIIGLGVLAYACRRRLDATRESLAYATEIGLVLMATLALSGISWKAQFVAVLLPYTAMLAYLVDARYRDRGRRRVIWWLLASFVLCTLTSDIISPRGADLAEALGLLLYGALTAGGGLLVLRGMLSERSRVSDG